MSQLQRIYPNNEFTPTGSPVISANSPKANQAGQTELLNIENFPTGNGAVVKFGNERLIFNDQQNNIIQKAYLLIELIQAPSWAHAQERLLGFGCISLKEAQRYEGKKIRAMLFKAPKKPATVLGEVARMFHTRPDLPHFDDSSFNPQLVSKYFKHVNVYTPEQVGLLQLQFGYLDKEQIV